MEFAKPKKERKPLPGYAILIIVLSVVFLGIGIIRGIVEAQTEIAIEQYKDLFNKKSSSPYASSVANVGITPVSYRGISVLIPEDWDSKVKELEDGLIHEIILGSPDSDGATILWCDYPNQLDPKQWAEATYKDGSEYYQDFSPGPISETTFLGQEAYTFTFTHTYLGVFFYSRCTTFIKEGHTFAVLILSPLKSHLDNGFGFIEETLRVQ